MLISFTVTAKLICVFVFAYANRWFSHEAAHFLQWSCVARKPVLWGFRPGQRQTGLLSYLQLSDLETRHILLSGQRKIKALIRLHRNVRCCVYSFSDPRPVCNFICLLRFLCLPVPKVLGDDNTHIVIYTSKGVTS